MYVHFNNAWNARSFQLDLTDRELVTVELQHMKDVKLLSEKVGYKPYNLADIAGPITINTLVEIDLDLWGSVQITGGRCDTRRKHYGVVYLASENEDIFYQLEEPFRTGAEIVEVSSEDINGDGLRKIFLCLKSSRETNGKHVSQDTWEELAKNIFIRMKEGARLLLIN